ncbi:hypothetical protein [Burkholderia sp. 3C]
MSDAERVMSAGDTAPLANFDLDTAWLRHAQADRASFFERFVAIVSQALPHHAQVHTVRRGLLRKTEHVVGISITFDTETFVMRMNDGHHLSTEVEKKVRGVVLSTRSLAPGAWMQAVMAQVHASTDHARTISELLAGL